MLLLLLCCRANGRESSRAFWSEVVDECREGGEEEIGFSGVELERVIVLADDGFRLVWRCVVIFFESAGDLKLENSND